MLPKCMWSPSIRARGRGRNPILLRPPRDALRARLGTHKCGNMYTHARCSRAECSCKTLLQRVEGTTRFCPSLLLNVTLLRVLSKARRRLRSGNCERYHVTSCLPDSMQMLRKGSALLGAAICTCNTDALGVTVTRVCHNSRGCHNTASSSVAITRGVPVTALPSRLSPAAQSTCLVATLQVTTPSATGHAQCPPFLKPIGRSARRIFRFGRRCPSARP